MISTMATIQYDFNDVNNLILSQRCIDGNKLILSHQLNIILKSAFARVHFDMTEQTKKECVAQNTCDFYVNAHLSFVS